MSAWNTGIKSSIFFAFVKENWLLLIGQILIAIVIGARGLEIGADTARYADWFKVVAECHCLYGNAELGFNLFGLLIAFINDSVVLFFFCICMALFALTNIIAEKVANLDSQLEHRNRQLIFGLILLAFLFSPFYISAHINAIRQGMAAFIVFYAFLSLHDRNWGKFILASIIAVSFHFSSAMYLALFPVLLLPFRFVLALGIGFSLLYATGLSEEIVREVSNLLHLPLYDFVAGFRTDVNYQSGIRYDFLIFSWSGLLFALIVRFFISKQETISELIKIYILLLIPFLTLGFANFSNRYAYTAWLFLSILTAYAAYSVPIWSKLRNFVSPYALIVGHIAFVLMALNDFAR